MFDRVIKGGTIVDGTGEPAFTGDVAIADGRIVEVGKVSGAARETIDASGLLVTPGWVDIHSHYDGQISWDQRLTPSFWHGVSTVVMGNCGVGCAPVRADRRDWCIGMLEGVEDIPSEALSAGVSWDWETFPQYLDAIDRMPLALDVGAQMAHGTLRTYAMGERGALNQPATSEDIALMARLVREAQDAGALGFTTSRTVVHRSTDGEPVPGTFADMEEIRALAQAVVDSGHGVMEVVPAGLLGEDVTNPPKELAWMNEISAATGCRMTFLSGQNHVQPTWWREQLEECGRQRRNRALVAPQMFCRAIGIMVCLRSKQHPFVNSPTFKSLQHLPYEEMVRRLKADPALRKQMATEGVNDVLGGSTGFNQWRGTYALGEPADYEPDPANSVLAISKREGRTGREVALDILLERDGSGFLHRPVMGYADGDLRATYELLKSPYTLPGGGDGGAHVATICDAGAPTFLLTHWVRDRTRGPRLPLEFIVKKQTHDTASFYGMTDRGQIRAGMKADINLIDFDNLVAEPLHMVFDLPAGAQRLMQKARGYVATMIAGEITLRNGEDTGARPGRLVRSGRL